MAKRVYEEENIANVAAKIRELIGNDTQYTSYDLADGVEEVFEAGYQAQIEEIEEIVAAALKKNKEVVNITSIDEPYETFEDLPETAPNGTNLLVNAEKAIYSFDTNTGTWENKTNLKAHTAYVVLSGEKSGIYRYTMAEPYLISAEENAFGKAKKYADENTVSRMFVNDEADGNLAVQDYKDGKSFADTYNRVYVELTSGRGLYSRYCLTAVDAPLDPDTKDYAEGKTLDSIPMRMSNGYIMSPIIRADDAEALAKLGKLGYNTDYYLMPKSYIDSYADRLFTLGEGGGLMHGNGVSNTGKCNLAVGVNVKVTAAQASAIGDDVEASAWGAFAINRSSKAKHAHSFVGGIGNFSTREGQTTLGRYAAGDGNYNFLVGVGDSAANPKNGFGVMYDGRVLIGKDPTAPMHAVPLHLLEERLAAIVGSAPETLNALNELATALGNDPNFATTVANQIGAKASKNELQETESAILDGLSAILAAQEEILGGGV